MATKKKLLQAAAGSAGGAGGLNIEDVFSTYLRSGTGAGTSFSVSNNIDLSGEGGLVWYKRRTGTAIDHVLVDSERGAGYVIESNTTDYSRNRGWFTSFNSDGFSGNGQGNTNDSGEDYASWTFRKAPKFFDVVTATSIGSTSRVLSHNLGCDVGFAVVKRLDSTANWFSRHRSLTAGHNINLNTTQASFTFSGIVSFDSTTITINEANFLGTGNYVVYLFAHNDGDGEFGSTSDQDIIKCGSYTGNGSTTGPVIDLGFEPQWLLIKRASGGTGNWFLVDTTRGLPVGGYSSALFPNTSGAEDTAGAIIDVLPTGFQPRQASIYINASSSDYIYIAIRRGPMAVPESATDVFAVETRDGTAPAYDSGFPVDMAIRVNGKNALHNTNISARLTQKRLLLTDSTAAEQDGNEYMFDYMDGWNSNASADTNSISWMWKRAPSFMDVVAYTGNGTAGRTVSHNLGVAPEMIWVKVRNLSSGWPVWHTGKELYLNSTAAKEANPLSFNNTDPTNTSFTLNSYNSVNGSGYNYIAYLFASVDGVSKVGSFTYSGTTLNVDCGFSNGARFVLYKRYDSTGSWLVLDTERGINASANDPVLYLNTTDAEDSGYDLIEPYSAGFTISGNDVANGDYIFYAIA